MINLSQGFFVLIIKVHSILHFNLWIYHFRFNLILVNIFSVVLLHDLELVLDLLLFLCCRNYRKSYKWSFRISRRPLCIITHLRSWWILCLSSINHNSKTDFRNIFNFVVNFFLLLFLIDAFIFSRSIWAKINRNWTKNTKQ